MREEEMSPERRLLALSRYIGALEQGDSTTVMAVLHQAEQDRILEHMLLELGSVYQELDQTAVSEQEGQRAYQGLLARLEHPVEKRERDLVQHQPLLSGQVNTSFHHKPQPGQTFFEEPELPEPVSLGRHRLARARKRANWFQTLAAALVACVLIGGALLLIVRIQPGSDPARPFGNITGTGAPIVSSTPSTAKVTPSSPVTQTSCPAAGTARPAITPPLRSGSSAALIYTVNEGTENAPTFGTVKRYNVATGAKIEIIKQAHARITEAQVSADGQWVIFVALISGQARLQLVRVDGQELQTLYCGTNPANVIGNVQWSTDQRLVVFNDGASGIVLLTVPIGALETLLKPASGRSYTPRTWLDTTRLLLTVSLPDSYPSSLVVLNTSLGRNQPESKLTAIFTDNDALPCWDFDTSYDGVRRFISQCSYLASNQHPGSSATQGPSKIMVQNSAGGAEKVIYSDPRYAITSVRIVSTNALLFLIDNQTEQGSSIDTSHNGLWKINMDGTGLMRLTSATAPFSDRLNQYTQYPWSNVSRDGAMYALNHDTSQISALLIGSLSGSSQTTIASISDGTQLNLVGWIG